MRPRNYYCNRQDAREGGEIPPLPRNCERTCFAARRCDVGARGFEPGFPLRADLPMQPLKPDPMRFAFWEGSSS